MCVCVWVGVCGCVGVVFVCVVCVSVCGCVVLQAEKAAFATVNAVLQAFGLEGYKTEFTAI